MKRLDSKNTSCILEHIKKMVKTMALSNVVGAYLSCNLYCQKDYDPTITVVAVVTKPTDLNLDRVNIGGIRIDCKIETLEKFYTKGSKESNLCLTHELEDSSILYDPESKLLRIKNALIGNRIIHSNPNPNSLRNQIVKHVKIDRI